MEEERFEKPAAPGDPRSRVLYPFFALWLVYGGTLAARVFGDPSDPTWEAIQRYTLIAALGLLARYKTSGWTMWLPIVLTAVLIVIVATGGSDPVLAAKLGGVFVAAMGLGQLLRGRS